MKKAVIIIRSNLYRKTVEELEKKGFYAFSSVNVLGRGNMRVEFSIADGSLLNDIKGTHRFMTKKMIIVYINDDDEALLAETVIKLNRTGQQGDGKIFIIPVNRAVRLRTGEENEDVLV